MDEKLRNLMSFIGLKPNTIQVFELPEAKECTLIYPNYFSARDVKVKGMTDEKLLELVENLMEEHIEMTKKDLQMVKSFRKTFV